MVTRWEAMGLVRSRWTHRTTADPFTSLSVLLDQTKSDAGADQLSIAAPIRVRCA